MSRTVIDVDDDLLEQAAQELGTRSKKDTVNAALQFVALRRRRLEQVQSEALLDLGVGSDIGDSDVMRGARR